MRRLVFALAVMAVAITACSDSTSPTSPETPVPDAAPAKPDESLRTLPGCPTDAQIRAQIDDLFRGPLKLVASAKYLTLRALMIPRNHRPAQKFAVNFVEWTLEQFDAGRMIGDKSEETQARTATFVQSIYCAAGLPVPEIPAGALDSDGVAVVVNPSNTTTTVVTDTRTAGMQIPPGAVTEPTLITVNRIPGQLLTQLDQYPLYYEFHASPELPGNVDVVVGVCIANDLTPPDVNRLRVAHNVPDPDPTTIEILPLAPTPFLDCTDATSGGIIGFDPSLWQRLGDVLATTGRAVRSVLAPAPLYAKALATTGLGGTTKKLSPFGVVDTLITVTAVSPTHITGIAGAPVPPSVRPSVRVATPTNRPVTNYPVTFAVPSGSEGSVTGGSALTNGSGIATVGSWTLGSTLGTDLVNATVAPPHLHSGVAGTPVAFSATVESSTPVGYKSAGYSYSLIGNGPAPSGWETAAYTGVGGWPTGSAGFGTNFATDGCTIVSDIQTAWPAAPNTSTNSDILLRKSVVVPDGWTGGLSIAMAIDNDAQVFVNGVDITATAGVPAGGFMVHEGCATRGSFVFTAPNNILLPGTDNLIAVRARDRGRTAFFDMQVTLVP